MDGRADGRLVGARDGLAVGLRVGAWVVGQVDGDAVGGGMAKRWRVWCWAVIALSVATLAMLSAGDVRDILRRIRSGTSPDSSR